MLSKPRLASILRRALERLDVDPIEIPRLGRLFLDSMLGGVFVAFLFTAAGDLFFSRFDAAALPWIYISSGLLSYGVGTLFERLARRLSFEALNLRLRLALAAAVLLLAVLLGAGSLLGDTLPDSARSAAAFVAMLLVVPSATLFSVSFWSIQARVFNLRESKRLAGLISTGEVVASMVSFFLVPLLLRWIFTTATPLLLAAAAAMALSAALGRRILTLFPPRGEDEETIAESRREASQSHPLRSLLGERYFAFFAGLITASVLCVYLIDFAFFSESARRFADSPGRLAAFLGVIFGLTNLFELLVKIASGNLLSQLGLRFGLGVLPVVLLALALAGIALQTLGPVQVEGAESFFFQIVVLLSICWGGLHQALFGTSLRVLYHPLPPQRRLAYRSAAEGQIRGAAVVFVGTALLILSRGLPESLGAVVAVASLIVPIAAWLLLVTPTLTEYRSRLRAALERRKAETLHRTPLDRVLENALHGAPEELPFLAALLERLDPRRVPELLVGMLRELLPDLQVFALRRLAARRDPRVLSAVRRLLQPHEPERVRREAEAVARILEEIPALAADTARCTRLARSDDAAQRELAARAIAERRDAELEPLLAELLLDRAPEVRHAALRAAGRLGSRRFRAHLFDHLGSAHDDRAAADALLEIGPEILDELTLRFRRSDQSLAVRLRLLWLAERLGGGSAKHLFHDILIRTPQKILRRRALEALADLGITQPDPVDTAGLRTFEHLGLELEHCATTIAWNLAAMLDLGGSREARPLRRALEAENARQRRILFQILSLLHDADVVDLVRSELDSGADDAKVYALEILDQIVDPRYKPLVLPAAEGGRPALVLRRFEPRISMPRMSLHERLLAITRRDPARIDDWTKVLALHALGLLAKPDTSLPNALPAGLFHPEPLIQEAGAWHLRRLSPNTLLSCLRRMPPDERERLERTLPEIDQDLDGEHVASLFRRTRILRRVHGCGELSHDVLLLLTRLAEPVDIDADTELPQADDPDGTLYVLLDGLLDETPGASRHSTVLGRNSALLVRSWNPGARTHTPCSFLRIDGNALLDLMAVHPELLALVFEQTTASGSASSTRTSTQYGHQVAI